MAIDARIKVTRELLNNAFIELLEEKPLSKITVKEICERADINRSTYYAHYENPHDQFENLKKIFFDKISEINGPYKRDGNKRNEPEKIVEFFNLYYENRRLFLVIANSSNFNDLIELVDGYTKDDTLRQWIDIYPVSDFKKECAYECVCAGFLRILYNWLSDKNEIKDVNEVASIAVGLFSNIRNFLMS